jgi:hypothetical protein
MKLLDWTRAPNTGDSVASQTGGTFCIAIGNNFVRIQGPRHLKNRPNPPLLKRGMGGFSNLIPPFIAAFAIRQADLPVQLTRILHDPK